MEVRLRTLCKVFFVQVKKDLLKLRVFVTCVNIKKSVVMPVRNIARVCLFDYTMDVA